MHRRWLCIPAAVLLLCPQFAAARNIFLTPGDVSSTGISTFTTDPFSFVATIEALGGVFTVLPSADPNKYYAISRAGEAVVTLTGRFPILAVGTRLSVGGSPTTAALSPDGSRLLLAGSSGVAVIDATTDRVISLMGNIDAGASPNGIAFSIGGRRAFVISESSSRLTAIDLSNNSVAGTLPVPSSPSAITVGPNGVVYVSGRTAIYEVDPQALSIRASIPTPGTAGRLQFTPNGQFALAPSVGTGAIGGAFLLDVANRRISEASGIGLAIVDVAVTGNNTAYGIASNGTVYVMNLASDGTLTFAPASFQGTATPGGINEIAVTAELPNSRFLILSSAGQLYRVDLESNTISDPLNKPIVGRLALVTPPQTGGAFGVLTYNATQTSPAGAMSLPLVIRAHDQSGSPSTGVNVTFSTTTQGVTINTPSTTTNLQGFASTTVNLPAGASAPVTVTASIQDGARTAQFTITPGDPNLPGPGTPPGQPGGRPTVRTGLHIISGHGQGLAANFNTRDQSPLRVRLADAQGQPIPGAQINWTLVEGGGNITGGFVTTTNSSGESENNFTASGFNPSQAYQLNRIRATAPNNQSVEFFVLALPTTGDIFGNIDPVWPLEQVLTMRAGDVLPIRVAASITGTPTRAPFIGLRLVNANTEPSLGPVFECRGGIPVTNLNGEVICELVAYGAPGIGSFTLVLGETRQRGFTVTVESGAPANVRIISGTPQSGNPGQTLTPLQVEVTDAAGNLLRDVPLNWEVPAFFGIANVQNRTDFNGRASAVLRLPTDRSGTFNVRAVAGSASATFALTVNVVAGGIAVSAGNNQNAVVGQAFQQPVQVRVTDAQGQPLQGASVTFAVTSGSATVNPTTGTTNASGLVAANVTAGNTPGPVVITATSGAATATFNLTVRLAGPGFTAADILNAAGFLPGVSPGSIAYIRAAGIAPALRGSVSAADVVGPLPMRLSDVEVLFNNVAAPVYAVSNVNGQESVIVQVPFEIAPGAADVTIRTAGGGTTTVSGVQILPVKPGVFTFTDTNGSVYTVATRPDGSYVTSANPARRGEEIRIYATGLGQTSPGTATNRIGLGGQQVSAQVIAGVNNAGTRVISSELLPGAVGVYVITMEIPADTATGQNQPIGLAVTGPDGSAVFANGSFLPIV